LPERAKPDDAGNAAAQRTRLRARHLKTVEHFPDREIETALSVKSAGSAAKTSP